MFVRMMLSSQWARRISIWVFSEWVVSRWVYPEGLLRSGFSSNYDGGISEDGCKLSRRGDGDLEEKPCRSWPSVKFMQPSSNLRHIIDTKSRDQLRGI